MVPTMVKIKEEEVMTKKFHLLISAVILISVLALPAGYGLAAALPNFVGINYGPYHKAGQDPNAGTSIPDAQFLADLGIMAGKFTYIKTYGCDTTSNLSNFVPLVSQNYPNLKVFLGVYEDGLDHAGVTQPQLDLAISQANAYPGVVKAVVVGNECLNTDNVPTAVTIDQLIADLQYVRNRITDPNILVTTCLGYGSAQTYGNQLKSYCDVMMVNIYPFYAGPYGIGINNAWNNLQTSYNGFSNLVVNGNPVIVGETGWPSAGDVNGSAVPSVDNEQTYTTDILANGPSLGPIFAFEAFDEPWKTGEPFNVGPHWGLWDQNGNLKFSFGTYLTRDSACIGDVNGNSSEELAFLRHDLDRGAIQVHVKDSLTGGPIKRLSFFGPGWTPLALAKMADLNANGSQEIAVLAYNRAGTVRVMVKDAATGALINKIDFNKNFTPTELLVRGDNSIGVMGTNAKTNVSQVEFRNPLTGGLIQKVRVLNELYNNPIPPAALTP